MHRLLSLLGRLRHYDIDSLDNRNPAFVDWVSRRVAPQLSRYHRAEVRGLERVPKGPALLVGNHNGSFMVHDSVIFCAALYRRFGLAAMPFFLGHTATISLPVAHRLLIPLGAVRASHENAHRLFARGHKLLVYPGGDIDAMRPFRHRHRVVFGGRQGYVRLAVREGVPIVPVVAAGAHSGFIIIDDMRWLARAARLDRLVRINVWPLTLSVPWGLTLGPPPPYLPWPSRILVEVLPPVHLERHGAAAAADSAYVAGCAARIERSMEATLRRLAGLCPAGDHGGAGGLA